MGPASGVAVGIVGGVAMKYGYDKVRTINIFRNNKCTENSKQFPEGF